MSNYQYILFAGIGEKCNVYSEQSLRLNNWEVKKKRMSSPIYRLEAE